ncbi:hypothetical protein [Bradyrhizobium genosp. A]|uniref:hypothetical protein n=1 Tax=Bradyrhizobium genosp. A TaxID=83626 RepID=UPI003CE7762C
MRDKVGGVAPAGLLLIERRDAAAIGVYCHTWLREHAMRNIAELLVRFWQGSQPASNPEVAAMAENQNRSSMADFVRILRFYDQDQWGDRVSA